MILNLCEMFHCVPSVLDQESAEIIRLLNVREMGTKREKPEEE
jgi:hypothetical protein